MQVNFGFLTSNDTYSAELPDDLDPTPLATSTLVAGGMANTIQLTPTSFVAQLRQELTRRADLDLAGSEAQVYERTVDPALLIALWPVSWGAITTQTAIEPIGQEVLSTILDSVRVYEDTHRIPRLTIAGGITVGNRREPIQRDSVRFIGSDPSLWYAVEFDDTQGLGSDGKAVMSDVAFITSTLPFGISVTCSGPTSRADDLASIVESIASSTTVV